MLHCEKLYVYVVLEGRINLHRLAQGVMVNENTIRCLVVGSRFCNYVAYITWITDNYVLVL